MVICSKCGTLLPDNNKFCFKCGTKVDNSPLTCSKCGNPVNPNAKFCRSCGNSIGQPAVMSHTQEIPSKPLLPLVCEICGGNNLIKENGFFTCQHCGTKYSLEEARKMMIEGTVQVAGTVRVDNSEKIGNYLMMATSAFEVENFKEAEEYANKVIEIDPHNSEAWFIKGKAAGWQSTLGKMRLSESVQCWSNTIAYSGNMSPKYQQQIANEISRLLSAIVLLKVNLFAKSPVIRNANELLNAKELIEIIRKLQTKTKIAFNEKNWREYIAASMNGAASQGFDTAQNYYGDLAKDKLSYKYPTWIDYCDNCIAILGEAMDLAETETTLLNCFNNAVRIQRIVISSKSFAFNGQAYVVDQTLSKQNIVLRKKAIKSLALRKEQNLNRIQTYGNFV